MTTQDSGPVITGKHVLLGMLGLFGIIIAVNLVFVTLAVGTFTGVTTANPYQEGLAYNQVLAARDAQRDLGWRGEVSSAAADAGRERIGVTLSDAAGRPLTGLRLEGGLRALLGGRAAAAQDIDAVENVLDEELRKRDYHAQLGRTPPLRELMLWRQQRTQRFEVDLPGGPQSVHVDLLDGFVSRGWSSWARCGRGSAGGWATDEKLYAIVPAYDDDGGLDSETFRVVFLGHEAQHFADQNRYPDMPSWELEYRAKLVELAQAEQVSAKRLRSFITAQGDDPDSPHTYANRRVVVALARRLGRAPDQVSVPELQAAARDELLADSARR